jgi:hypothetical protein
MIMRSTVKGWIRGHGSGYTLIIHMVRLQESSVGCDSSELLELKDPFFFA